MTNASKKIRTLNVILLSVALAFMLAIPVMPLSSGGDAPTAGAQVMDMHTEDSFFGTIDLEETMMEQYIVGEDAYDNMGWNLVTGDLNGDMVDDIVITSPFYNNTRGGVFIYFGGSRNRQMTPDDADIKIDGHYNGNLLGVNVEMGDVDNDGMMDLLVTGFGDGDSYWMTNYDVYPEAYLFLGSSGWGSEISVLDADVKFIGSAPGMAFGYDCELGDINNDGYDDVIISQIDFGSNWREGMVFIFEGDIVLQSTYNVTLGEYSNMIHNSQTGGYGFWHVASTDLSLGDINGDEYMDIIMGSAHQESNGRSSGQVDVVFGSHNLPMDIDLDTYSHVIVTSFPDFELGFVEAGDFDGDGIDDLIVNAPYGFNDHTGGVWVFYGDQLFQTGSISLLDADFYIRGPSNGWGLGVQVIDDINDDGRDDLIIHSSTGHENDRYGVFYLFYSNITDTLRDPVYNMKFETPDFRVKGALQNSGFGAYYFENIAFLDYDGDGLTEILFSDPYAEYEGMPRDSGAAAIYYQTESEIRMVSFNILDAVGPDQNIVGAGEVYHFYGYVTNTWDIYDVNRFDVRFILHGIEVDGEVLVFSWDRGLMEMKEAYDPNDWTEIVSSAFIPDEMGGMHIYFNMTFKPYIPSEEPMDMVVDVQGGKDLSLVLNYPSIFQVEPDVEFYGDLIIRGSINGVLNKGDYVQPGEKIEVTGVSAAYQGTAAPPPNDYFSVRMMDSFGNVFLNSTSSGKEILFTYRTQELAGREEINLTIIDLVGEADDESGYVNFFYLVDTDMPEPPEELEIKADSDIDTLIGYDNDPQVFITWAPASDPTSEIIGYMYNLYDGGGTGDGWFTSSTQVEFDNLQEGWNTIYVWSVDSAQNYGPATYASVFYDVDEPTFGIPNPGDGSWVNSNTVNYEITLKDIDGSGVKGSTVEYAISYDGGITFSSWEPTNLRRNGEQITVKIFLNFREGDENFVKWRARDVSGNGYVESDPFQVKVDTVPLTYKTPSPSEPVDTSYVQCAITLTDGKGSGIDSRTIQYSISHNGVSNYGPWETLDLSGAYPSVEVSTPPIYFERDTLNYIKWRAKDLAGNGYTYSLDIPIEVLPDRINHEPVPIITEPLEFTKYLGSKSLTLDGSNSLDADGDELSFLWYSDKDGYLGTDPIVHKKLSENNHLITLHVDDGIANVSITVQITVVPDITSVDTDRDGKPDIIDDDDDDDGLLDIEEDLNMNGLLDGNETDPKNKDTDGDGVSDLLDHAPRDPNISHREVKDTLPGWLFILMIILILIALIVFGAVWYMKQRTDKERMDARRNLRMTRRNLKRYEVLTGVPTNDLPAIEAIQWALPGVINEASDFVLDKPSSEDLLPPSKEEVPQEEEMEKPDLEDMEVPTPVDMPEEPAVPDEPEGPEPPSLEEEQAAPEGGKVLNCALCGSEIVVPDGASQVECPLCGEINDS